MRKQTEEEDDDDCDGGDGHFNGKQKHCTQKSESFFSWFFLPLLDLCYSFCLLICFSTHTHRRVLFLNLLLTHDNVLRWKRTVSTTAVFIVSWGHHPLNVFQFSFCLASPFLLFFSSSTLPHFNWTDSLSSFNLLLSCNICSSAHHMQLTALLSNFFPITLFCIDPLSVIALSLYFFSGKRGNRLLIWVQKRRLCQPPLYLTRPVCFLAVFFIYYVYCLTDGDNDISSLACEEKTIRSSPGGLCFLKYWQLNSPVEHSVLEKKLLILESSHTVSHLSPLLFFSDPQEHCQLWATSGHTVHTVISSYLVRYCFFVCRRVCPVLGNLCLSLCLCLIANCCLYCSIVSQQLLKLWEVSRVEHVSAAQLFTLFYKDEEKEEGETAGTLALTFKITWCATFFEKQYNIPFFCSSQLLMQFW